MFRILLDLGDKRLEEKMARRLAGTSGSLEIVIGTDFSEEADLVIDRSSFGDYLPVSKGFPIIADKYMKKTGKPLCKPEKGFVKLFRFTSPTGGSGLSSLALTFARLMAGKAGDKVLLIDIGRDGSFIYAETDRPPVKNIRELEYRAEAGLEFLLNDYLVRDHYGVDIYTAENIDPMIFSLMERSGAYDTIVTAGLSGLAREGGMDLVVINTKDSRMCDHRPEGDVIIHNRDYINNIYEDRVLIAEDGLSFKNPSGKVIIAMDGDLAYGVEKLMRKVVNEYEYV